MTINGLKIISDAMNALGLNYGFGEYRIEGEEVPEIYFVGEYQEAPVINEDGMQESTFLLTGFSRGSWFALEIAKETIKNYFNKVGGHTVIAEDGTAVAIFYSSGFVVPTGDAELRKIQINLDVKEWSVK
jgi:hypothetical protein